MAPDTTFERYKIDNFVPTNSKRVPYEELDYSIYKNSSQVAFSTTESRLPLWVKALYERYYKIEGSNGDDNTKVETKWHEEGNQNQPTKCDKIVIEIIYDGENVLTITVNISAGRIQVQGRLMKEWGAGEFEHVLAMVSNPEDAMKTKRIDPFLRKITNKEKPNLKPNKTERLRTKPALIHHGKRHFP